jgi:hypothetical protein
MEIESMRPPHENGKFTLASYFEACQYGSAWFLPEWRIRLELPSYGQVEALITQPRLWEPTAPLRERPNRPRRQAPKAEPKDPADAERRLALEPSEPPQPYYQGGVSGERSHAVLPLIPHLRAADFANSTFRGFTYNYKEPLRPRCSVEEEHGSDSWVIKFVVPHRAELCCCFDKEAV